MIHIVKNAYMEYMLTSMLCLKENYVHSILCQSLLCVCAPSSIRNKHRENKVFFFTKKKSVIFFYLYVSCVSYIHTHIAFIINTQPKFKNFFFHSIKSESAFKHSRALSQNYLKLNQAHSQQVYVYNFILCLFNKCFYIDIRE